MIQLVAPWKEKQSMIFIFLIQLRLILTFTNVDDFLLV